MNPQLQTVLDALEKIACLGNGDKHGNSVGNVLAIEAIGIVKEMMAQEPVNQYRVLNCADWYDGFPDTSDGKRYKTRTLYVAPVAAQAVPEEKRTLWVCRACGHLHGEKVSSCDCMENGANEYNEWVAAPKGAV